MEDHRSIFKEIFGSYRNLTAYFCPGRVNLIGEHIDYLGGSVMPCAISLGIHGLYQENQSSSIRIHSIDFGETVQFEIESLPSVQRNHWSDFVLGVFLKLRESGIELKGGNILLHSDLPTGAGLSSSAAIEVLTYFMCYHQSIGTEPDRTQMALHCQQVENDFVGVSCGIMDQFAVANGKHHHAILLNCETLKYDHIPILLGDYQLLIINTKKPRKLAESAYNQRIDECNSALKLLQKHRSITHLVQSSLKDLALLDDEILRKRARHASTEETRVKAARMALSDNDLQQFGQLLFESHASLRDDFEVSCAELDFIVDHLKKEKYCLGARVTGAGFGGCCIALIHNTAVSRIEEELGSAYYSRFGQLPSFYTCFPSDGVHDLT